MKRRKFGIIPVVLCVMLFYGCAAEQAAEIQTDSSSRTTAVSAETAVYDESTCYVMTDPSGDVERIIRSETLMNAQGDTTVNQSSVEMDLPIETRVSYELNGREIRPENLAGQSGSVTIRLDYTNNVYEQVRIGQRTETIYDPLLVISAFVLDNDSFKNIEVTNGRTVDTGTNTFVFGYAVPGLTDSLGFTEESGIEIPEYIEVTAEARNFAMGPVYTVLSDNLLEGHDVSGPAALSTLLADANEMSSAMDRLLEGAEDLNTGVAKMLAAAETLSDRVGDLKTGAETLSGGAKDLVQGVADLASAGQELQKGSKELAAGAGTLSAGVDKVASGAKELSAGAVRLDANSGSIDSGARKVFQGLLSTAMDQIREAGLTVPSLKIDNYHRELDKLIASLDPDVVYAQILMQVTREVESNRSAIEQQVTAAVYGEIVTRVTEAVRKEVTVQATEAAEARIRANVEANRAAIRAQAEAAVRAEVQTQVTGTIRAEVRAQVIRSVLGMSVEEYEAAAESGQISEEVRQQVEAVISAQMSSGETQALIESIVNENMNSASTQALIEQKTDQLIKQLIAESLASAETQAAIAQQVEAQMSLEGVREAIDAAIREQMASDATAQAIRQNTEVQIRQAISEAMAGEEVQKQLKAAAEGSGKLTGLEKSLDDYNAFYVGLQAYTASVGKIAIAATDLSVGAASVQTGALDLSAGMAALNEGLGKLNGGIDSVYDGASGLSDGADSLYAGIKTMDENMPALVSGIAALKGGSDELSKGLSAFNDRVVRQILDFVNGDLGRLKDRLNAISNISKQEVLKTKFVYRTKGIE